MITFSLQSGSNGNCIYVEAGGVRLLFDAGISGKEAAARMACHGRDIHGCDALIISHDHSDHVSGAGVFHRKFGVPIHMTRAAHTAVRNHLGEISDVRYFTAGDRLEFGTVRVQTIPTPHDGIDTVCFVVEHEGRSLGIMTDLGHPFRGLERALEEVDAAYLECNYDPHLLWNGRYAEHLKRRIAGQGGHISNDEAAELTKRCTGTRLKWLAAAHLSQENNRPDLAIEAHRRRIGTMLPVFVASRYEVGRILEV
ncbi:MAG: MBL fold metallo-hydrolase [Planctomycetota bacterium]